MKKLNEIVKNRDDCKNIFVVSPRVDADLMEHDDDHCKPTITIIIREKAKL